MVSFNKQILSNGLTILHEKRDVDVTTVMFAVPYGAMFEKVEEKGISHLIEHLCFKGTNKRDAKEISNSLESVGGELNAFTHEELTAYHVRLPSEYLELAIDVLGDIFFNPTFPENEVEREKNVICEEIKMYQDRPSSYVMEKLKSNLYEEPFGMFIGGSEEVVRNLSRDYLLDAHHKYYVPKNAILCVVGNNSFEEVIEFAERYVGFNRDGISTKKIDVKKRTNVSSETRTGVTQANVAMGIHVPYDGKGKYIMSVFNSIFGDGMSSKLFEEIREKRGLVYAIKSELDMGINYGYLLIFAGTDRSKVDEVMELTKEIFFDMKNISEDELEKAKMRVIGNKKIRSEESSNTAVNLIFSEIYSDAKEYYEYEKEIMSVTLDDIRKIVENVEFSSFVLEPENPNF